MAFLVVGLGNPGPRYGRNRHNAGFMAVEKFAEKVGIEFSKKKFGGTYGKGFYGGGSVFVFKPETYMNNSGEPVRKMMRFHDIDTGSLIAVHDEVDLPVGRVQVKLGGGSAGHNGIKSIVERTGSGFTRVRIGVGRPEAQTETADHVLSDFRADEIRAVEAALEKAADAVCEIVSSGAPEAMNKYNAS